MSPAVLYFRQSKVPSQITSIRESLSKFREPFWFLLSPQETLANPSCFYFSLVPTCGFVVVLAYVTYHWVTHGLHFLRVKGEAYVATSLEGGAIGGGITTTHYDEKRLSVAALETVRRGSVGYVYFPSG